MDGTEHDGAAVELINRLRLLATDAPDEDAALAMAEAANLIQSARSVMQRMACYGRQSLTDEELSFLGMFISGDDEGVLSTEELYDDGLEDSFDPRRPGLVYDIHEIYRQARVIDPWPAGPNTWGTEWETEQQPEEPRSMGEIIRDALGETMMDDPTPVVMGKKWYEESALDGMTRDPIQPDLCNEPHPTKGRRRCVLKVEHNEVNSSQILHRDPHGDPWYTHNPNFRVARTEREVRYGYYVVAPTYERARTEAERLGIRQQNIRMTRESLMGIGPDVIVFVFGEQHLPRAVHDQLVYLSQCGTEIDWNP